MLKYKLESERRKSAYLIFANILAEVSILKKKAEDIEKKLKKLEGEFQSELTSKQTTSQSSLVFEIDLSYKDRLTIVGEITLRS